MVIEGDIDVRLAYMHPQADPASGGSHHIPRRLGVLQRSGRMECLIGSGVAREVTGGGVRRTSGAE